MVSSNRRNNKRIKVKISSKMRLHGRHSLSLVIGGEILPSISMGPLKRVPRELPREELFKEMAHNFGCFCIYI